MPVARASWARRVIVCSVSPGRDQHQVSQLINDDHQERQFLAALQLHLVVVVSDVAGADLSEHMIALVHFTRHPLQCADDSIDLHHHRRQQVWDAVVSG